MWRDDAGLCVTAVGSPPTDLPLLLLHWTDPDTIISFPFSCPHDSEPSDRPGCCKNNFVLCFVQLVEDELRECVEYIYKYIYYTIRAYDEQT